MAALPLFTDKAIVRCYLLQADTFQPEVPLLEECKVYWKG